MSEPLEVPSRVVESPAQWSEVGSRKDGGKGKVSWHPGGISPTKGNPISPTKSTVNIRFSEPSAAAPIASRRELASSNGLPGLLPAKRSRKAVGSVGGLWIEHPHMRHPHSKHGLSSSPPGGLNMLPVVGSNIMTQSHGLLAGVAPEGGGEAAGKTLGGVSPAHTHAGLHGRGRKPSTAPEGAHEGERDGVIAGGQAARSMLKSGGGPIFTISGDGNTSAVIPLIAGATAVQARPMTRGRCAMRFPEKGDDLDPAASETLGARIEKLLDDTSYPAISTVKGSLHQHSANHHFAASAQHHHGSSVRLSQKSGQGLGADKDSPPMGARGCANPNAGGWGRAELLLMPSRVSTPMIAARPQVYTNGNRTKGVASSAHINRGIRMHSPIAGELTVNGCSTQFFPHMTRSSLKAVEADRAERHDYAGPSAQLRNKVSDVTSV